MTSPNFDNAVLQAVANLLGHAWLSIAQMYTGVSTGRMMDEYSRLRRTAKQN